jgi:hypothetical protein
MPRIPQISQIKKGFINRENKRSVSCFFGKLYSNNFEQYVGMPCKGIISKPKVDGAVCRQPWGCIVSKPTPTGVASHFIAHNWTQPFQG